MKHTKRLRCFTEIQLNYSNKLLHRLIEAWGPPRGGGGGAGGGGGGGVGGRGGGGGVGGGGGRGDVDKAVASRL
jgi:hypothetical protein